jgi:lantibiotic modifying enzyme
VTLDDESRAAAAAVTAGIARRMLARADDPDRCTDVISGDAGILLALVEQGDDPVVAEAASAVADGLVRLALDRPDGLHWRMDPEHENLMPGFSHGTAGVAYALGRAGETLGRADLVEVAVRAADGLLALGHQPGGGWRVPLLIPPKPGRPTENFGWCHGPTGTIRLFGLLQAIAPDPRWERGIGACLRGLRDGRIPERLYPGYWDNVARCCGTAGVGQVLIDRYQATGDPEMLAWSRRLADDVLARRLTTPAGVTWSNFEHTADPPDLPPEPGFMQGAAGVAGWLARLGAPSSGPALAWL